MRIYVCSKKYLKKLFYSNSNFFYDEKRYFISIAGPADGCEYPCPFLTKDSKRVLHLLFDDVTESEKDNPAVILFDDSHANKIKNFTKTIPNDDVELYINCAAGISRSGAVGTVLNDYFNKDNKEDYKSFYKINSHILPNPMVKRILSKVIFDKTIFSN